MGDRDLGWLGGFIDGEGTFGLYVRPTRDKNKREVVVRLSVGQGGPRLNALERCREILNGLGAIRLHKTGPRTAAHYRQVGIRNKAPIFIYTVERHDDLARIVPLLDKCPFVAKAGEYLIWRAAALRVGRGGGAREPWLLEYAKAARLVLERIRGGDHVS